jgi:predicted DCC family thiol-disulfide oxidoreductase YuxK
MALDACETVLEIWYDGSCPVCVRSRRWCERRDRDHRLRFRDFRSADDDELPADRERHRATMMARTPEGVLLEGFLAWRRILATLPRWRWLARSAGIAPLAWFGSAIYRVFARHRDRLPVSMPPDSND